MLISLFEDLWNSNNTDIGNSNNGNEKDIDEELKVLDIYQIKSIILIIFENIILGYKKIIELSSNSFDFPSDANASTTVTVTSDSVWVATSNDSWITVSPR